MCKHFLEYIHGTNDLTYQTTPLMKVNFDSVIESIRKIELIQFFFLFLVGKKQILNVWRVFQTEKSKWTMFKYDARTRCPFFS